MSTPRIGARDVEVAIRATDGAPPEVCALALDVLSRQGQAHLLFAGKDYVEARAKEHKVEEASFGGISLLPVLERGPSTTKEHAVLCALAVRGLQAHTSDAARLSRFVRDADWLTFSTPYAPYSFVDPALGDQAAMVWRAVADANVSDDPSGAARKALHQAALARSSAREMMSSPAQSLAASITGELRSPRKTGFTGVLRLASGWALLQWFGRLFAWAARVRRRGDLSIVKGGLRLERRTTVFGKTASKAEETFTLAAVASAGRSTRYPTLHLLVGALAFAIGVLAGGVFLFDGIRSGETVLLLIGAGLVLGGGAIDLALSVLVPASQSHVDLDVAVLPKRRFSLRGVPQDDAEAFLQELRLRLDERR